MSVIKCKGCEKRGEYKGKVWYGYTGAVGEAVKKTGFSFVLCYGGGSFFLCHECGAKDDRIYFPHLLRRRDESS